MIRYTFFIICFSLINAHTFLAMNYVPQKNKPLTLDEQLLHFDQRMRIKDPDYCNIKHWDNKKTLSLALKYMQHVSQELPDAITNNEIVKKYADHKESLFAKSMLILVDTIGYSHYENVTSDTLKTIQDSFIKQSCSELNDLPYTIKKYIMTNAYDKIDGKYIMQFPKMTTTIDIHKDANLAATADKNGFFVWDLTTLQSRLLTLKKPCNAYVKFSSNGAQLITVTCIHKEPLAIDIDIWNSKIQSLHNLHTITHSQLIQQVTLENGSENAPDRLFILDSSGIATTYTIEQKKIYPILSINTGITCIHSVDSNLHYGGDYEFCTQTQRLTKKSIPFSLCKKAIKNTQDQSSLEKIEETSIYLLLTLYEKRLIQELLNKKITKN